jgi:hypothetical protein
MMVISRAGVVYFLLVFGAGLALGVVRTLWVDPQVGTRLAELLEMPVTLLVMMVAARWAMRRLALPARPPPRLGMGFLGLGLPLTAELALVVALRGMTLRD